MNIEKNYDFLKRMQVIHQPQRRTLFTLPENSVEITSSWVIRIAENATKAELRSAEDFQAIMRKHFQRYLH